LGKISRRQTLTLINKNFYWPKIYTDLRLIRLCPPESGNVVSSATCSAFSKLRPKIDGTAINRVNNILRSTLTMSKGKNVSGPFFGLNSKTEQLSESFTQPDFELCKTDCKSSVLRSGIVMQACTGNSGEFYNELKTKNLSLNDQSVGVNTLFHSELHHSRDVF
jgi:hypothetical protein